MNATIETCAATKSIAARHRLLSLPHEPLFLSDWRGAVFIHYEVDAGLLQRHVPFDLDLWEGRAFVSLVAFTMHRMRPRFGGVVAAWVMKPIATHEFLNFRAYVRHQGEPGIYFLAEWLSNRWAVHLGPRTFGLPYRFGHLHYAHSHERGALRGMASNPAGTRRLSYEGAIEPNAEFKPSAPGTLDEFLLERYTAFTKRGRTERFFRIWHLPWAQSRFDVGIRENSLLTAEWPWLASAELQGAHCSPGVENVWMGWPHRIR